MMIYALPVIDGELVEGSTDLIVNENKAKIVFYILKSNVNFIDNFRERGIHSLSFRIDVEGKDKVIFDKCKMYFSKIDSCLEEIATIELTAEKINQDKEQVYFRELE